MALILPTRSHRHHFCCWGAVQNGVDCGDSVYLLMPRCYLLGGRDPSPPEWDSREPGAGSL